VRLHNIRLLSCCTGKSENGQYCFAEELSNALGVTVEAPDADLFVLPNGELRVNLDNSGHFITFTPNIRRRLK
jgi:hypothetical protein